MRLNPLYVALLLLVLTSGHGRAQDGEIIAVSGMYSANTQEEYRPLFR